MESFENLHLFFIASSEASSTHTLIHSDMVHSDAEAASRQRSQVASVTLMLRFRFRFSGGPGGLPSGLGIGASFLAKHIRRSVKPVRYHSVLCYVFRQCIDKAIGE
jgi:hypothetical protein